MEIQALSRCFAVRRLTPADVESIFELSRRNEIFYQYHPPMVTRESILEDMDALPPGKEKRDKYYIGYFEGDVLVALMDLILDYPHPRTAFIGLFMLDVSRQGQGTGTKIISDCAACMQGLEYEKMRLAVDEGNPQSEAFWLKNRFEKTGERYANGSSAYLPMERCL